MRPVSDREPGEAGRITVQSAQNLTFPQGPWAWTVENGSVTTPQELDEHFRAAVAALSAPERGRDPLSPVRADTGLTGAVAMELFDAQLASRHLDLAARWLRSFGEGF